ncbi:MAG: peptidyl-alpha-hydroxyglycine alpha-amidating lyase family protein [Caulobacteraceae bacterium]
MRKQVSLVALVSAAILLGSPVARGQSVSIPPAVDNSKAPVIAFDTVDFIKLKPGQNLGEVLGVAVNSKGHVVILNHPGTATTGPLYGNASTEVLEYDANGNFVREIGHGVYGLGYSHAVRFDKYDNLWVVDKGTDAVMKFNPSGKVALNLGRRAEGFDSGHEPHLKQSEAVPADGWFRAPTDVAWDQDDNIFVSDGYINSRIAKFDKYGDWIKTWGKFGPGGAHANENPYNINNPHNMQTDRDGNVYVADRGNRRIHVYDREGQFKRFMFLNAPYDKTHHPALGGLPADPSKRPDETQPWTMCISPTTPQYLFVMDQEPGRLYKMSLDGKILGMLGQSGRRMGQFNWPHAIACPTENTIFVADMNNWRVQKLTLHPERTTPPR